MFVNIVHFPPIKPGKDEEFLHWFAWSNEEFTKHRGFIRRQLLKPLHGGSYAAIVEHESFTTFQAMHTSSTQSEVNRRVQPLFDGEPKPEFFDIVVQ